MGQSVSSGNQKDMPQGEIQELGKSKLVVEQIQVIRQREVIKVPVIEEVKVETIKYVPKNEETIKYNTVERETVKYNAEEKPTVKYNVQQEETIKYVPKEIYCEKPILVDTPYERPVITPKEYTIVTYRDIEAIRELMSLVPKLLDQLKSLKDYQIVKEVIKVPDIKYVPTTIKRIKETGELVEDVH